MNNNPFNRMASVAPQGENGVKLSAGAPVGTTGMHDVKILKCTMFESRANNGSGLVWCVEHEVLRSSSPPHIDPVGSRRSWTQRKLAEDLGLGALKSFIHAAFGATDANAQHRIDSMLATLPFFLASEHNPLAGLIVHVNTLVKMPKSNFPFTLHTWSPFDYAGVGWTAPTQQIESVLAMAQTWQPPAPQQQQNYGGGFGGAPPMQQPQQQAWGGMAPAPQQQQAPWGAPQGGMAPPMQPQQQAWGAPQGGMAPPMQPQQQAWGAPPAQQAPQQPQQGSPFNPQGGGGFAPPGGGQGGWNGGQR